MTIKNSPQNQSGNDLYREIAILNQSDLFRVTYWDLWFVMLQLAQFGGDWDKMIAYFRNQVETNLWKRDHAEGLLNHLRNLRQSLDRTGLTSQDILQDADPLFLKKQKPRAKRRILDLEFQEQEFSLWMIETPRKFCEARAMRGYWTWFPVSPLTFAADLAPIFQTGRYYLEKETFKLGHKLSDFLKKYQTRLDLPGQLALYRAFLTVVLENMGGVNDSYGVIGQLYEDVFKIYFQLDRSLIDLPLRTFFQDLLELLIWENYGFTYRNQPDFFTGLSEQEVPIVAAVLRQEWQELGDLDLLYQSEKALTLLGMLYAQKEMFEQFIPIAQVMGTREWQRITRLAEAAEKCQQYDLALAVYENCFGPGFHEAYLHEQYEKLKNRIRPQKETE